MAKRKIIKIDEAKCNGCGKCILNCHEGAIQIIDKKARLIGDLFCDGLGACIGHCPQGAITIEEREAAPYDEKKAMANIVKHGFSGCPGSRVIDMNKAAELKTWPVQIMLVPVNAPYFNGADLLIAADCVPFAYADFHQDILKGKVLLVGCPKLDDLAVYKEKISAIVNNNDVKSITYAHMEVPCCYGLINVIKEAIEKSKKAIPFKDITITIRGEKRE
ncbi:MAG: 4Fe-4S dicluster domain-containing protein [Candidatus Omnitrophica bacterium]|nr:4Fe-4S dicluster domain-containing protein [Candidatus Omnitrophota bacterium]